MALNPTETAILTVYLTGHGIVEYVFPNDAVTIQKWLNTKPNIKDYDDNNSFTGLKQLLHAIPFNEKEKLFSIHNTIEWYSSIVSKVEAGTDTKVQAYIDTLAQLLTDSDLVDQSFISILIAFLNSENTEIVTKLLTLLQFDERLTETSINKMKVEFNSQFNRYQILGLSQLPTIEELETILGF